MRLTHLTLRDIGPFASLELEFPAGRSDEIADVHLLAGPNGTGKSTILQAIAQLFTVGPTIVWGKVRSDQAVAVATHSGAQVVWAPNRGDRTMVHHDGQDLNLASQASADHFGSNRGLLFHLQKLSGQELSARAPRFEDQHALVFAYGPERHAPRTSLATVAPLTDNPLAEAALFDKRESQGAFIQWIASLTAQQALAEKQGDAARAVRLQTTLSRVADAVAAVTGGPVQFEVRPDLSAVDVRMHGALVPHTQLPAGLDALLSWIGDLLMRLDRLPWVDDVPVERREFVLLLDEVEVHLHPAWQRKVLPMVERLFPKAQIIAATHSPFVIQSASDAWVHPFALIDGRSEPRPPVRGPIGSSYSAVLRDIMGVDADYSVDVDGRLAELQRLRREVLGGRSPRSAFDALAVELSNVSDELYRLVAVEARQLDRQLATQAPPP